MYHLITVSIALAMLPTTAPPAQGDPSSRHPRPPVRLRTVYEVVVGNFGGISGKGVVKVLPPSTGRARQVPLEDVEELRIRPALKAEGKAGVFLATGGRILGRISTSDKVGVTLDSPLLGRVKVKFNYLLGCLMPAAEGLPTEKRIQLVREITTAQTEQDLVLLDNGDCIPGVVEVLNTKGVEISGPLGRQRFPLDRVLGIAFSREGLDRTPPRRTYAQVTLVDGSTFAAHIVSATEREITLKAVVGFEVVVPLDAVSRFEIRNGRTVRLSDLEPKRVTYQPYYNRVWPMRRNRSVWGRPLSIRGRVYSYGLGLASRTVLTYDLAGAFERLEAEVGIDDETRGRGIATVIVATDGKRVFHRQVRAKARPIPLSVPLTDVQQLTIIVDYGPDTDAGDHVDICNARLIRVRKRRGNRDLGGR